MKTFRILVFLIICAFVCAATAEEKRNWNQFRGPDGDGISLADKLPVKWSEHENVKWKIPVAGKAWSSPVIWGNQVWVSSADEDGRRLYAFCYDVNTGRPIFEMKLFDVEKPQAIHKFNSYASPTPVIEENRVYITFGCRHRMYRHKDRESSLDPSGFGM